MKPNHVPFVIYYNICFEHAGLPSGTTNSVGPQSVRPRVSDPTAGQAARPQVEGWLIFIIVQF